MAVVVGALFTSQSGGAKTGQSFHTEQREKQTQTRQNNRAQLTITLVLNVDQPVFWGTLE